MAIFNKAIMNQYFREGLKFFIRTHLDARGRDLDSWKEAVKKAVNVEAKALLQSPASTRDMDSNVSGGTGPLRRRRKTPVERKSPSTLLLLIHLVGNSHLPLSRLPPLTQRKTTAETIGVEGDEAKTLPQRALTPPQRRKK